MKCDRQVYDIPPARVNYIKQLQVAKHSKSYSLWDLLEMVTQWTLNRESAVQNCILYIKLPHPLCCYISNSLCFHQPLNVTKYPRLQSHHWKTISKLRKPQLFHFPDWNSFWGFMGISDSLHAFLFCIISSIIFWGVKNRGVYPDFTQHQTIYNNLLFCFCSTINSIHPRYFALFI